MLAKTFGSAVFGVDAHIITVEVSVGKGTKFFLVGLPDSAIKESEQRVEAAIKQTGYAMPRIKTVVNLAPADIRKEGSAYDLPIALGILAGSGQITAPDTERYVIMGELSLERIAAAHSRSITHCHRGPQEWIQGLHLARRECHRSGHR